MTALVHPHAAAPVHARIEIGHWVVQCGTLYCRDALRMKYGDGFLCPSCGVAQDVIWPDPDTALKIRELLRYRPDWATRNWLPGEDLNWLLTENLVHGIDHSTSPEVGAAESRLMLDATGDNVRLVLLDEPITIDQAVRPEVEA